ncbi:hypothetical protein P4S64_03190 [Vibrio sp. M60_M31a]
MTFHKGNYPATVNDVAASQIAAQVAEEVVGEEMVNTNCLPLSGSEDFFIPCSRLYRGCYVLLGNGSEGEAGGICVHNQVMTLMTILSSVQVLLRPVG